MGKKSTKPFSCQHILRKQASVLSCELEQAGAEDRLLADIPISFWIFHQERSHESSLENPEGELVLLDWGERALGQPSAEFRERGSKGAYLNLENLPTG